MEKNTVVQLRRIAKDRGLHGYSRLRKDELIRLIQSRPSTSSAASSKKGDSKRAKREKRETDWSGIGKEEWEKWLNKQTEKVEKLKKVDTKKGVLKRVDGPLLDLPIPQQRQNNADLLPPRSSNLLDDLVPEHGQKILKPTKPQGVKKKIEKAVDWGKKKVEDWGQWLKGVANTPQARHTGVFVANNLKDFKEHINELYKTSDQPRFKIFPKKSSLKQFAKMYTIIDGVKGYGVLEFLQAVKPIVINFLQTQKNIKIKFVLRCNMSKTNIATGETTVKLAYFKSFVETVIEETDRKEIYEKSVDKMRKSMAKFMREGSGWDLHSIKGLDLHTVKYTPLKGSSYIKLPKHLERKMAIINMKNKDEECFKWCVTRALYPVRNNPERITKILKKQVEKLVWDGIEFPMEAGIRGGISMIPTRHSKANNKYMEESFDPTQPSKFIMYLDANNLYGWAMSKSLPTGGFKWVDEKDFTEWKSFACILEVDLKGVTSELHDHFNDYPPAPENLLIGKVHKLVCTLNEKKKYIVHHETLKHYMSLGIEIGKIHRVIRFNESPWMKKYIDLNTSLRAKAKNEFEKDFYKLMNNAVFGKTMENIRKRVDVRLVNSEEKAKKLANKVNFEHCTIFSEDLCAMHMRKTQILFNKPLYLGMSILDISKTLMYDFHYNYIKPKYPNDKSKLLFTDTDSLCYEIQTEDFYRDITNDVDSLFDTSNIREGHCSGVPTGVNKKVIGMFKDEAGGKIIEEFVGLRAKLYSYKMFDDGEEKKKCKGVKQGVVERTIGFDDYKRCLFGGEKQLRKMNTLRSRKHEMYMEEINKVALSADDDKRIILPDKIHTYAIGHCREHT
ncbi:hypothetical protein AWC38_SpisGene24344 [Stylophora pistillata]|uniref:Rho termination factor-like N-terminal domain-containing protein n=1 Tax=Stylophora pistillata TaxID=50429 RepID=A0A2B4R6A0_STYPI|nr:hypothetical protein AWC38_SpisGene24344 [Stylophora pistillata]